MTAPGMFAYSNAHPHAMVAPGCRRVPGSTRKTITSKTFVAAEISHVAVLDDWGVPGVYLREAHRHRCCARKNSHSIRAPENKENDNHARHDRK